MWTVPTRPYLGYDSCWITYFGLTSPCTPDNIHSFQDRPCVIESQIPTLVSDLSTERQTHEPNPTEYIQCNITHMSHNQLRTQERVRSWQLEGIRF